VTIETPVRLNSRQKELLEEFKENESNGVFPAAKGFLDKLKKYFSSHN
jgi:DnaJ-class molecular chaperone